MSRIICDGCDAELEYEVANGARVLTKASQRDFLLCDRCLEIFNAIDPRAWPRRISLAGETSRRKGKTRPLSDRGRHSD